MADYYACGGHYETAIYSRSRASSLCRDISRRANAAWNEVTQSSCRRALDHGNSEGWHRAGGLFTDPTPQVGKAILVVSNYWGPASEVKSTGETAEVTQGYIDMGRIDSALRYSPPRESAVGKTALVYHLVTVPTYLIMYGPDGKTLLNKKPAGTRVWQIKDPQGLPFATVNTAVRYVLEMRDKTTDPAIRKHADETLARLLERH
jgi:hypothetical protein